jgi:hypothetical protein
LRFSLDECIEELQRRISKPLLVFANLGAPNLIVLRALSAWQPPPVWAPLVGILLAGAQLPLPHIASKSLDLIGEATSGTKEDLSVYIGYNGLWGCF